MPKYWNEFDIVWGNSVALVEHKIGHKIEQKYEISKESSIIFL